MSEFIYQSLFKSEKELRKDFVVHQAVFEKLMNSISENMPHRSVQHIIIQGQRGMGKTTLLNMVYYEALSKFRKSGLITVFLSEQHYSIRSLNELWIQTSLTLSEKEQAYSCLMKDIRNIKDNNEKTCDFLKAALKMNEHRLLVLIDDFGTMLNSFARKEHQRLREMLITSPDIQIIGSSGVVTDSILEYRDPFFEFFLLLQLEPLTSLESITLVSKLAEKHRSKPVMKIIKSRGGLIDAVRLLTGGSPRIMVMFFNIMSGAVKGNSTEYFLRLLDHLTPQYRCQMDALPEKQLEIVHTLALNWDGMKVSEMEGRTTMESKTISAQLNNLLKKGLVFSVKPGGKNKFYQLNDRLFNIWYLMNSRSSGSRDKVTWLLEFLEYWYPVYSDESFIQEVKEANHGYRESSLDHLISDIRELLSIQEPEEATRKLEAIVPKMLKNENYELQLSGLLAFAARKGLRHYILKLFQQDKYLLKDRFKVLYYALIKVLNGEESREYLRMGRELEEPVGKMVSYILKS